MINETERDVNKKKRYFFEIRKIVETGKMVIRELIFLCKYYIIMEPNEKKGDAE